MSRWDAVLGALFILAATVVVAKLADLQFDRFFYASASIGGVLLLVSRYRLAYVAAAFAWMGLRLFGAGAFAGNWRALGAGAIFCGIAYVALMVGVSREEQDRLSNRWR